MLARDSLERICRTYWQPVFVTVRLRGVAEQDAEDVTQAFFEHAIERMSFAKADRMRGKFRTFLLGMLHRFLFSWHRDASALKRGGGVTPELLDEESIPAAEPHDEITFDREWALTVMQTASGRLRDEWQQKGGSWEVLRRFLPGGDGGLSMSEAAERCGMSEGAFKVELHRLRRRMKELLRAEVAKTVSAPHEIDEELAHLRRTLEQT